MEGRGSTVEGTSPREGGGDCMAWTWRQSPSEEISAVHVDKCPGKCGGVHKHDGRRGRRGRELPDTLAMARSQSILSAAPTNIVRQHVTIGHVQLRDLIICPDERGIVNYVHDHYIMERDITNPSSIPTPLVQLNYVPNTIASLQIPGSDERLLAAGGQDAELHLSIHSKRAAPTRSRRLWQYDSILSGSINNSVLLTSLSLTRSNESSAEPRVAVSNNDCTVKFFDVNVRGSGPPKRITSISPDGRTLLSVGDSPHVYLHGMTGGARITFTSLAQLTLPPVDHASNTVPASFSTAFSPSGTKFAVASQEGVVAVWDVRSRKPMTVYHTDRSRAPAGRHGTGMATGYLYDEADTWDWTRPGNMQAPGWGVRNVKFSPCGHGGREIMTFTEHTSLLHVVDATTFETEQIVRVPSIVPQRSASATPASTSSPPTPPPQPSSSPATTSSPWPSHIARTPAAPSPSSQPRIVVYNSATGSSTQYRVRPSVTARISTSTQASTRASRRHRARTDAEPDASNDAMMLVPAPADHGVDRERHGRHALGGYSAHSVHPSDDTDASVDEEEDVSNAMDVDESDCQNSRASSPVPRRRRPPQRLAMPPHLDLAGTCFDPEGGFVYVASTGGIVEWGVRGAEKRWWTESVWA
ncbi:hypothetical protein BV25DRAFT_1901973 [Artomyces pyxidatus]|uniref:Uncharacterized protein n=1 Tax=Artomyces pyxidatus TaxID=48021 RepID=A0ACB8SRD6_9AGAM|nr:hypothetical protein BV25DRAFT_1901973 [Artomyces pyxidatus]